MDLFVDLSSNNARPDLKAHRKAGRRLIGLKATEGTSYTWTDGLELGDQWHELGGSVVWYHFARAGSGGGAQAAHFLSALRGHMRRGDVLVLDLEGQPAVAGYAAWKPGEAGTVARAFMDVLDTTAPRYGIARRKPARWVYGPPYFLRDNEIRPRRGWGWWAAQYADHVALNPPGWTRWEAWQYTDRATNVPGVPGAVDQNRVLPRYVPAPLGKLGRLVRRLTRGLAGTEQPATPRGRRKLRRLRATLRKALGRG